MMVDDYGMVSPSVIKLLTTIENNPDDYIPDDVVSLVKRGMVDHWPDKVQINILGMLARRRLFKGARIVSNAPLTQGRKGVIVGVHLYRGMGEQHDPKRWQCIEDQADAVRLDGARVDIIFDGNNAQIWCFYEMNRGPEEPRVKAISNDWLVADHSEHVFNTRYMVNGVEEAYPKYHPSPMFQRFERGVSRRKETVDTAG